MVVWRENDQRSFGPFSHLCAEERQGRRCTEDCTLGAELGVAAKGHLLCGDLAAAVARLLQGENATVCGQKRAFVGLRTHMVVSYGCVLIGRPFAPMGFGLFSLFGVVPWEVSLFELHTPIISYQKVFRFETP